MTISIFVGAISSRGSKKAVGRGLERAGEGLVEKSTGLGTENVFVKVVGSSSAAVERRILTKAGRRMVLRRIARGTLIAVPV